MIREAYVHQINKNFLGFIDTTLREGLQFAGRYSPKQRRFEHQEFTVEQSAHILRFLYQIGIRHAEVPSPLARGKSEYIRALTPLTNRPNLFAHIRACVEDLEACRDLGVEGVHVLANANPDRIAKMRNSQGEHHTVASYSDQVRSVLYSAREMGYETRLGVEHAWDADIDDMLRMYAIAEECGASRINIADTRGTALPFEVAERVEIVKNSVRRCLVQVHLHDDTGMSVSNALSALAAGASFVDTSLLGIGERVGITPLSKLVVAITSLDPNILHGFNMQLITESEQYVADVLGMRIPYNLPSSPHGFAHTAGLHLNGIKHHGAELYQPIHAGIIGGQTVLVTDTSISGKNGN